MRVPLHILPEDQSPEAAVKRLRLWDEAMARNPKGFREAPAGLKNPTPRNRRRYEKDSAFRAKVDRRVRFSPLEQRLHGQLLIARHGGKEERVAGRVRKWLGRFSPW